MASIFSKIISSEIPSDKVYEDDRFIVIKDINPEEKTHLLVIPKKEIISINSLTYEDSSLMWEMILVAKKVVFELWIQDSYRLRINAWDLQEIPHLHMHILSKL